MIRKKSKKQENEPAKVSGRQRLTWPVIEGIAAAAAMLGAPEALIKSVKKNGSKAFMTGNRVDTGILIPELFTALIKGSELPEGIATPQDWLATEKAKREAIKRREDEKSVMLIGSAKAQASAAMSMVFGELERRDREMPPALAGQSAVEIGKRMAADTESMRRSFKLKFEEIGE